MPGGEILAGLAGAVIPSIGAQASAQMQRRWALEDLERQNLYNSPAEQLKRLKAAGLPAAAFFSGGVSSQSDQPRATNVDPTLGTAEGMSNYFLNRMQSMQMKALDANITKTQAETRSANADADIKEGTRDFMLSNWKSSPPGNRFTTPLFRQLEGEVGLKEADAALRKTQTDIERITASYKSENEFYNLERNKEALNHIRAQIKESLSRNELLKLQFSNTQKFTDWQNRVIEQWEKSDGKVSTIELMMERLLYGGRSPFVGTN